MVPQDADEASASGEISMAMAVEYLVNVALIDLLEKIWQKIYVKKLVHRVLGAELCRTNLRRFLRFTPSLTFDI